MTQAVVSSGLGEHLPVLQVVVPLMAAAVCVLLWNRRLVWGWATLIGWSAFGMAVLLVRRVLAEGPISYAMGGWPPPWGIELRVDVVSAFVVLLVTIIAAVVLTYSRKSVAREVQGNRIPLFYAAFLLCLSGLLGITVTGDVFNVFVFLEVSSLSTYALVSMGQDRRALTAAYRYLIMGSIGATFIVIGIGMMYAMTGTLNMADLAQRLPPVSDTGAIRVAFGFLTVGIALKLALFPLHLWLPNAYTFAPSSVTAFIAATSTKVAVYMLLRFFFTVFGAAFSFDVMQLDLVLLPLALVAIFSTSLVAIFQVNIKRMLAYSSLAQIGYMILGVSFASLTGVMAATIHLFNHAMMKGALFMALGCVMYRIGSVHIEAMYGLGRRMPWTMGAFVGAGLSLIGVPLTVGFISKWYLILGALERGWWPVAVVVLITSLMAVMYIWRVVEAAYFRSSPDAPDPERAGGEDAPEKLHGEQLREAPLALLVPTWTLVLVNFYFGIDASLTTGLARRAAETLLGVGP